jgi:hypothetical protein
MLVQHQITQAAREHNRHRQVHSRVVVVVAVILLLVVIYIHPAVAVVQDM